MCDSGPPRVSTCCAQKAGSACAAPTPHETKNYYSRNHKKRIDNYCKGSCYCPGDCKCPHKGFDGRFAGPKACDPNAVMDGCPGECKCCSSRGRSPARRCPKAAKSPEPCRKCSPCRCSKCCAEPCCQPCCPPYKPPCRKPVCYPPVKCCENDCESPLERICYYPCPVPPKPKYCTCGSANPCDCDLNEKKRNAICEMAPCCRRCGRKVYAAEQIMASGGAFHSACFSCYSCHKPLEVTNVYENQGEIYCKQCYAKYFGMQGYGYGSTLVSPL